MSYELGDQVSIPGRGQSYIFLYYIAFRLALGPLNLVYNKRGLSQGIKWPGREGDHSTPFSADVKKCGALLSLSHISSWHIA
jgi:hypothetical protein